MDNEKLVEFVREYPELYDLSHSKYSDNNKKEAIWAKIGEKLEQTGQCCKRTWINLRDSFRRSIKKRKETKSGQSSMKIRKWKYEEQMQFLIPYFQERETVTNCPNIQNDGERTAANSESMDLAYDDSLDANSRTPGSVEETKLESETPPQVSHRAENSQTTQHVPPRVIRKPNIPTKNKTQPPNATAVLMEYILKQKEDDSIDNKAHPIDKFFAVMADTVKSFSKVNQYKAKTKVFELISSIEEEELLSISETKERVMTQSMSRNITVDNVMKNTASLTHQVQHSNQSLRRRQSETIHSNRHFPHSTQKTYTDLSNPNYQSQHGKFQDDNFSCVAGYYVQASQQLGMSDEERYDEM